MYTDSSEKVIQYFQRIMTKDDILHLEMFAKRYHLAPKSVNLYLQKHCQGVHKLEQFLKEMSHIFFVENKRVALYDPSLEEAREHAVQYFKDKLSQYEKAVHYMTLRREHFAVAPDCVASFITRFYPAKEFKDFLKSRPEIFIVHKNETAFLVEVEAISYLERRLATFGGEGLHFMKFLGHLSQAPLHIRNFIKNEFPGEEFQYFLREHNDLFSVGDDGFVFLVDN